jgi:hypothetical protein
MSAVSRRREIDSVERNYIRKGSTDRWTKVIVKELYSND